MWRSVGVVIAAGAIGACAGSGPAPEDATAPPATAAKGGGEEPSASAAASTVSTSAPLTTVEPAVTAAPVATVEPAATAAPSATAASGVASAAPSAVASSEPAGTNLRIGSMTVDGLTLEDVACKADGLGVFGSMVVVGAIAKKKAALNACAPKGDKPRVQWVAAGGRLGSLKVKASTPQVEACVAKALSGAAAPFEGTCAATLVLGK